MKKLSFLLLASALHADFNALLVGVNSNSLFHFIYNSRAFYCQAAVVETPTMYLNRGNTQICKESVALFLKRNPKIALAYVYKLHEQQTYSIKPFKSDCFVMLNAGTSWSEYLLEEGYAILKADLDGDFLMTPEYEKLKRAQQRAQYEKRGIWSDVSISSCLIQ